MFPAAKKKKCMNQKIAKFIQRKFNQDLAADLGLSGRQRISVIFKIDKRGNVTGVRARAPHPRLQKEAVKVVSLLLVPWYAYPGTVPGYLVLPVYAYPYFLVPVLGTQVLGKVCSTSSSNR